MNEKEKNIAVFKDIRSEEWSLEEKVHAINSVLDMKNPKEVSAEEFRVAFRWFWDAILKEDEEKTKPKPAINLDDYETNKFGIPKLKFGDNGVELQKK